MKNKIKGFFAGVIIASLMMTSMFVYASEGTSMIEVVFNKINIAVNNSIVGVEGENYLLSSGAEVPNSILYKGTTYLPLRKVAELLGKEVTWDGSTSTAGINETVAEEPVAEETSSETVNQRQAVRKAESYVSIMAYSKEGLAEQLEFEGFSEEDAIYGAENCGADWMEEAVRKAKMYLDIMSYSRSGLIEQLEFEGFTHEQAVFGVDATGL